jgi:Tol biopolymer transport system component
MIPISGMMGVHAGFPCVALWGAIVLTGCTGERVEPSATLMRPQGETRLIDFETDEGTWMSLDVSPDGEWIVFDLLGHIYRVPLTGGEAEVLTQRSGVALNFHPAYSPDGTAIAFISDRSGQNNVWVMDADGSNPRPVLPDPDTRFTDPEWTPDGSGLVAVRAYPTPGRGWHRQTTSVWLLPLNGTTPRELLGAPLAHYRAPTYAPDGRLYYHVAYSTGDGLGLLQAGHRLQRLDPQSGRGDNVRRGGTTELSPEMVEALRSTGYASDVGGEEGAALNPEVSPDGKYVAFAQEMKGRTFTYRGHDFGPRTVLYIRDLDTGDEHPVLDPAPKELTQMNAQYSYRVFPGYSWTPEGREIIIAQGGKIRRITVETGDVESIPFSARVHREISQQVRGRIDIDDSGFDVEFMQWPSSSPDGSRLAFVAVGKIWVVDLPNGTPEPLTENMLPAFQLTPAWSPDGTEMVFATWHDVERGHVWKVAADGGTPQRLTEEPGEYIHPSWSPDGEVIVASMGPGPESRGEWNGWNATGEWATGRANLLPDPGQHRGSGPALSPVSARRDSPTDRRCRPLDRSKRRRPAGPPRLSSTDAPGS